jgi:hypothetical protein
MMAPLTTIELMVAGMFTAGGIFGGVIGFMLGRKTRRRRWH